MRGRASLADLKYVSVEGAVTIYVTVAEEEKYKKKDGERKRKVGDLLGGKEGKNFKILGNRAKHEKTSFRASGREFWEGPGEGSKNTFFSKFREFQGDAGLRLRDLQDPVEELHPEEHVY